VKLLFVCVENSCRSQMAEGFVRNIITSQRRSNLEVHSAGSIPSGGINPMAVDIMKERGIDISNQESKGLDALPKDKFDIIVTMGCGDNCPTVFAKKRIDWQIKDPKGASIEIFREVRDEIEEKVLELLRK